MLRTSTALALAGALLLTGCGSEEDDPVISAPTSASPTTAAPAPTAEPECPETTVPVEPLAGVSADLSVRPVVEPVTTPVGEQVGINELTPGTGDVAEPGSLVEVKYAGVFYDTGEEFDSSWARGNDTTLPPFQIGTGSVIPGFDLGVTGMAVGGRRVVTIPAVCGYGATGSGPIPPDTDLVFVIDLVSVQAAG